MKKRGPPSRRGRGKLCVAATLAGSCLLQSPPPAWAQAAGQQAPLTGYEQRLKVNPDDLDALEAIARLEAEHKDFPKAIAVYRRIVAARPQDVTVWIQLARLLGWNHQYDDSIHAYQAALALVPGDPETLEGLAAVEEWSGKLADAAAIYGQLASAHPDDATYVYQAARLEAANHQYPAARDRLATVLALDPEQLDARLLLAQLELNAGQYMSALRQFERVLVRRGNDAEALMGAAQARYYTADLRGAYAEASHLVQEQPRNFDAIYLLASIERARGHRHHARLLLNRANQLSRHNPEVAGLRERLAEESSAVLHLTAGYSHEIGSPGQPGFVPGAIAEDLRSFVFGSELGFRILPRSTSSFSADALPSESPYGIIGGAAAPTDFLYRQTTRVFKGLTLRGGIGMEHFGSGVPVALPNGNGRQPGATSTMIGFMGGTYALNAAWSLDLTWSHLALPYTPLAVRLGVVSTREEGGINWIPVPRTQFHLTCFQEHLGSEPYSQLSSAASPGTGLPEVVNARDRESGSGGTLSFNIRAFDGERLAIDLGASVFLDGYNGSRRNVDLGFFTPSFYQRELLDGRLSGRISKRFGYDLAAGFGVQQFDQFVQQVDQKQAAKRALFASPTLNFKITPYLSGSLGYTYYDSAQTLGMVRGNGVRVGIDCRF